MDTLEAIMLIEEDNDATTEQFVDAFQALIDDGIVWRLQGFYGRTAEQLIADGYCTPARAQTH